MDGSCGWLTESLWESEPPGPNPKAESPKAERRSKSENLKNDERGSIWISAFDVLRASDVGFAIAAVRAGFDEVSFRN
jgi:hypothetical protein